MVVIFVHGWSVRNLNTYGQLPTRLREGAARLGVQLKIRNLLLSQYISFDDAVTLDDIARTFQQAVVESVLPALEPGERFACITHSTGGPVVRKWLDLFYGSDGLAHCPMSHLVMLAPANHGSALAQLGKSRLSRIKFLFEGGEPGERVLNWLELGSGEKWELNLHALDYRSVDYGLFPFVLTGQRIDRSVYDHLNSYTGEAGSDGVVRACAANMNFTYICLEQEGDALVLKRKARAPRMAFGILPGRSHSGERMGIIRSVGAVDADPAQPHPTVEWVLKCLAVTDGVGYQQMCDQLDTLTAETQDAERFEDVQKLIGNTRYVTDRYSMFTFKLKDDRDQALQDYDLLLTAGPNYDENELPDGFFQDRQRNSVNPGKLTYYVDHDLMHKGLSTEAMGQKIGFRVVARPASGLAYYQKAELRSDVSQIEELLRPNETTLVEITLDRSVDLGVFRLTTNLEAAEFGASPLGQLLPPGVSEEEVREQRLQLLLDRLEKTQDQAERAMIRAELARLL